MGLLSFFKRHDESTGEAAAPDAVAHARTRARRRLIGATVLLGIGVIGFPLLFETQPRPIPVDIPIEIPRREAAPPLALPPAVRSASAAMAPPPQPVPATPMPAVITEREAEQGREVAPPAPRVAAAASAAKPSAPASAPKPASLASAPKPASAAAAVSPRPADGQRAQALLEGKPPAAASDNAEARIVVQVGAYTDVDKLREARQKVEKLGMKTYTQVVDADGGKRTRVRVGPFATRDEADKAAARIKATGLPVAILTL
ncbi:SPOR domain-containing protein [Aquabacterium sp.]|uniref:SPOR domain-containing protein n=1 Tax=Aquabacterium sp. TaxID=1872578 RepID=UPI002C10575F|nr:SPOR domain-containing protein [Aquabacterium sp.]HSW07242.1 SPOR domain-containing protein [Aquabacterium sp.]